VLELCRQRQVRYRFVPSILEVERAHVEIDFYHGLPILELKPTPLDGWGAVLKKIFDFFGALFGLLILAPFMLVIAILIKLDSRGPILFARLDDGSLTKRVGRSGKLFYFWKFRTMRPRTHNLRYTELAPLNSRAGTPMVKIKDDPRVTSFGKFLRRTSLDELPQLLHVLTGQMSLVGPRPHLPEEVARYAAHHRRVLTVKPGVTGLAQISGRSGLDFEEEVRLDTYYIENWSLWLDVKILLKTVWVVVKGRNAE
jgi:exopolysaccharide biosynthesis polyprenyl glycosylphosphotransferase